MSKDLMREDFPGGDVAPDEGELRIAVDKRAYSEVMAHAKEESDIEICGVFLGRMKQDKRGPFLHIEHAVRGEKAEGQGAQVKFTHDTWNFIYKEQERIQPRMDIVGWYHTHPGFDIFLSEHDKFIHNNFFNSANQVAYVYDPHQGTEGFFRLVDGKLMMPGRYWHGSKQRKVVPPEQRIRAAAPAAAAPSGSSTPTAGGDVVASVTAMNESIRRLELSIKDLDTGGGWSSILTVGAILLVAVMILMQSCMGGRDRVYQVVTDPKTGQPVIIEIQKFVVEEKPKKDAPPTPPQEKK